MCSSKRLKILVSAYACEPNVGSEPEVGWQWVQQLARFHDVWVITRANNCTPINGSGIASKFSNLHFEYYDLPKWMRFWKKKNRGIHFYYLIWQAGAVVKGFVLHQRYRFDVCHHITFSPFYQMPFFAFLPIPFMWGPLGGGEKLPHAFLPLFTFWQRIREHTRTAVRICSIWNPLVHFTLWRASLIIASTRDTLETIPGYYRAKAILEAQVGMNPAPVLSKSIETERVFKIITASRHVYWKGIILVIRAFARFLKSTGMDAELKILGEGPETAGLKEEVRKLSIEDHVVFASRLPKREDVLDAFAESDVFAYASLLECAGYVVLEALAQGTPIVCLDLPGPGEIVDETCGIRVPASDPEAVVQYMSEALCKIAQDKQLLLRLSRGAIERVEKEFKWNAKGYRLQRNIINTFMKGKICNNAHR